MSASLTWFRRWRLRLLGFLTVVAAAVISFDSVRHLAESNGFGWQSWLFPLTIDAVAAVGMDLWMRRSPAWRAAATLALVAIAGSLAANVADHAARGGPGAGVLGAVPPASLAALLWVFHRHNRNAEAKAVRAERPRPAAERTPPPPAEPVARPETAPATPAAPAAPDTISNADAIALIRAEALPSQRAVRARFGMGAGRAARLFAQANENEQENTG